MASSDIEIVRTGRTGRTWRIEQDLFQVFSVRDGKVVEYRLYAGRGNALESMHAAD